MQKIRTPASSLRTGRGVAEPFRPQEKAPLGYHDFPGLHTAANGDEIATQRTCLHGACEKRPLLVRSGDKDDLTLADGLHSATWEHDNAFPARRGERQGHVHAEP